MDAYTSKQTCRHPHVHTHITTYLHTCTHAYMHTCTQLHTHTYIRTHTHRDMVLRTRTHTQKHTMELCRVFYAHTCGHEPGIFGHDPSGGFSQRPLGRCEFFSLLGSLMSMSHFVCRKMLWLELCQKGVKRHRRRPSVPLQRSALSLWVALSPVTDNRRTSLKLQGYILGVQWRSASLGMSAHDSSASSSRNR